MISRLAIASVLMLAGGALLPASAQTFTARGFGETRIFLYPQNTPNDRVNVVAEGLFRVEPAWKPRPWLRVNASLDARIDTLDQVERRWTLDWQDRTVQRPPFSVRRLSAIVSRGGFNLEVGKQFIRWGKADVLNPTDRFAPRDFLSVVDYDFLAVTGVRLTYESGGNTVDAAWVPRFTPSRIPLFNQRWTVIPESGGNVAQAALPGGTAPLPGPRFSIVDAGARFPGGSQAGLRWNLSGAGYEFSLSFYNGYNHLPVLDVGLLPVAPALRLVRTYPQMRMYGGDFALPNRWVTLKGEFAYYTSSTAAADEYGIYVVQIERQVRDWQLVGGYAGDFVTRTGVAPALSTQFGVPQPTEVPFAADRGLTRAFLGRASVTLDVNRSLAFQAAVRRSGHGTWLQGQYVRAYGGHLRATVEGNLIRGSDADFIGQFHRDSNVNFALRYSF